MSDNSINAYDLLRGSARQAAFLLDTIRYGCMVIINWELLVMRTLIVYRKPCAGIRHQLFIGYIYACKKFKSRKPIP